MDRRRCRNNILLLTRRLTQPGLGPIAAGSWVSPTPPRPDSTCVTTAVRALGDRIRQQPCHGPTLLEDEPDTRTFDYANINAPIFFVNTVEHYTFVQELVTAAPFYLAKGKAGVHQFLHDFVTGKGTLPPEEWAWEEHRHLARVRRPAEQTPCVRPLLRVKRGVYLLIVSGSRTRPPALICGFRLHVRTR